MNGPSKSLSRSFMRMIFISCSAVLVITSVSFFAYDLLSFRQNSIQSLRTLGAVVARNSTAALAFENTQDAEVVLSALSADPTITVAALYDAQGQLFALYPRGADRRSLPGAPGATGFRFDGLRAAGFEPVLNGERQLGTLYVR